MSEGIKRAELDKTKRATN